MERESGYYWVKFEDKWYVASWSKTEGEWYVYLFFLGQKDERFDEIDERRIERIN